MEMETIWKPLALVLQQFSGFFVSGKQTTLAVNSSPHFILQENEKGGNPNGLQGKD